MSRKPPKRRRRKLGRQTRQQTSLPLFIQSREGSLDAEYRHMAKYAQKINIEFRTPAELYLQLKLSYGAALKAEMGRLMAERGYSEPFAELEASRYLRRNKIRP
jgi:hypothetical protein